MKKKKTRTDGRFEVKHTIPGEYFFDGKPRRKSFYSYISAADCEKQYETYLIELKNTFTPAEKLTVEEWARRWLKLYKQGRVKDNSFRSSYERPVENVIIPHIGQYTLCRVRAMDVSGFFADIADDYSLSYKSKIKNCLVDMFDRAVENDLIQKSPCRRITVHTTKAKNKKRTYSKEQVDKLLEYAKNAPDGICLEILLTLGLRCSELCGLRRSDLDEKALTLSIRRAATDDNGRVVVGKPKSEESNRTLPVTAGFARRFLEAFPQDGYILPQKDDPAVPISPKNFTKRLTRSMQAYRTKAQDPDFPILTPHEFRHTCGTLLYRRTHDIYAVSRFMGHSTIAITAKFYIHDDAESLRRSLESCGAENDDI